MRLISLSTAGPTRKIAFTYCASLGVLFMGSSLAAVSSVIGVLIADSNRMQAQLLTSALRRRSEFSISNCSIDIASILRAVSSTPAKVVLLSLNHSIDIAAQMAALRRVHLSYPAIAKILLVESYDRDLVVSAFRSGARGIFCISDTHFRLLCRCIQRIADGQIWANTEQLNFLLALVSRGTFAAGAQLTGTPNSDSARRAGGCAGSGRHEQSRHCRRTPTQRAHRQEVSVPHFRQAGRLVPSRACAVCSQERRSTAGGMACGGGTHGLDLNSVSRNLEKVPVACINLVRILCQKTPRIPSPIPNLAARPSSRPACCWLPLGWWFYTQAAERS